MKGESRMENPRWRMAGGPSPPPPPPPGIATAPSPPPRPPPPPPLVLVETIPPPQPLACACAAALAHSVRPGMTLPQARALCPGLTHAPHDPDEDRRALYRLARWLIRFSPVVAPEPPDTILLDVTGSEHLFGSLDRLLNLIATALSRLHIAARVGIAPTVGAAWAITFTGGDDAALITPA